jgi:hypothetical protein
MIKHLQTAAFGAGLVAIGWVGVGYLQTNPLALAITLLIGAFYLAGALELWRVDQATTALRRALDSLGEPVVDLQDWLRQVPESLRNAVRLRIEGERIGLPGPAMTPFLAGLLVLLGMLGTFIGMVVTLKGTGLALERATDLQTMRDSLAAPVKGLGLAFGTSVAGVAASALLGLMSALCRRQRLQAAQWLDTRIATTLRPFSRAHQRQAALEWQQQQAQLLPALVEQLQAAMQQLAAQARQSDEQLLAGQERFQARAETVYRELAASVDQSLRQSLADSARIAAATMQPAVEATMSGITRETAALHGLVAGTVQQQLDGLSSRFEARSAALVEAVSTSLDGAVQDLSATWRQTAERIDRQASVRDDQRLAAWHEALAATIASLQQAWQQAGALAATQQAQICATLEQTAGRITAQAEAHARSTIAEIGCLVQTASEAPRAAADVVAQLRDKLSDSLARDQAMLEERSRVMATLHTLLDAVQYTSTGQKAAIDALVASTAAWMERAGAHFTGQIDAETARMETLAAHLGSSAVEVASLGEALGAAVEGFASTSDRLMAHLQRIDDTLGKAIVRSDEQLAYYVAQAREVIDLSLMSQKQIIDDLQRLAARREAAGSEA